MSIRVIQSLTFGQRALRSQQVFKLRSAVQQQTRQVSFFQRIFGSGNMTTTPEPSYVEYEATEFRGVKFNSEETLKIKKGCEGDKYKRAFVDPNPSDNNKNEFILQIIHKHLFVHEGAPPPPPGGETVMYKVHFEETPQTGESVLKKVEYHNRLSQVTGAIEPLGAVNADVQNILSWQILGVFGEMSCPDLIGMKFDKYQTEKINKGFVPKSMDDHWAIVYDEPGNQLRFIRSWTGTLIFRMYFEENPSDRTLKMTKIERFRPRPLTNDLAKKQRAFADDEQKDVLTWIFKWLILGLKE